MSRPGKIAKEDVDSTFERICGLLREGEPMAVICRRPEMPHVQTVVTWRQLNPDLEKRYRQAREDGWDLIAWRCRKVAAGDESAGSSGDVKRDRLIVETDIKLLAKWDPKRYGDKIEHSGTVTHQATDLDTMTNQLVTQVTMNPTLKPVLEAWAADLLDKLRAEG